MAYASDKTILYLPLLSLLIEGSQKDDRFWESDLQSWSSQVTETENTKCVRRDTTSNTVISKPSSSVFIQVTLVNHSHQEISCSEGNVSEDRTKC